MEKKKKKKTKQKIQKQRSKKRTCQKLLRLLKENYFLKIK